jgi:hypothetical protein
VYVTVPASNPTLEASGCDSHVHEAARPTAPSPCSAFITLVAILPNQVVLRQMCYIAPALRNLIRTTLSPI